MAAQRGHLAPDLSRPAKLPGMRRAGAWLVWWVLLMSFWVILDDSLAFDELVAGAGAAALGATLAEVVGYRTGTRFRMRIEWVRPALRLPVDVARDTVIVFTALWRKLLRGEEPRGGFLAVPVRYGGNTASDSTRRVLLVGGKSVAPNAFVLGIDKDAGVMVVHKLVAAEGEETAQ
jgi:multisubunit Na+/H+ antiporter MnhE subunit